MMTFDSLTEEEFILIAVEPKAIIPFISKQIAFHACWSSWWLWWWSWWLWGQWLHDPWTIHISTSLSIICISKIQKKNRNLLHTAMVIMSTKRLLLILFDKVRIWCSMVVAVVWRQPCFQWAWSQCSVLARLWSQAQNVLLSSRKLVLKHSSLSVKGI